MNAIFAVNMLNGFGIGNTMPWPHSTEDMKRFRELTTGHTVVMGASTWLSDMPKPLPNRRNCVLSTSLVDHRCEVFPNITALMMGLQSDEQVFVIGGAKVLWALRPQINRVYFTRHRTKDKATVTLDTEKYFQGFNLVSSEVLDKMTVEIYERP
jgi:dihydrofolate reductase